MPAYRSEAEGEIRDAVVERLRLIRPGARIIHEINACALGNRIDVLAVCPTEIIAIEIKSKKDKLDRLPKQIEAMQGCAHHVIAAYHEKFLVEKQTNVDAAHYDRDGVYYRGDNPDEAKRLGVLNWVYPVRQRANELGYDWDATWSEPPERLQAPLPETAINILWAGELRWLCQFCGVYVPRRANMNVMVDALRWQSTGSQITKGICALLRSRNCIEADPIFVLPEIPA